ncbi:DUF4434 domain-containing protein [Pseudoalteromonas sp. YIC-827]|uniref:DUF4434 domain-containing protein n=1 Tax=Pseudoalteromonas qingdaonensis TaxID=3131913 RepID=A0ABU9MU03_9GAMM
MVGLRWFVIIMALFASVLAEAKVIIYQPLNDDRVLSSMQWHQVMVELKQQGYHSIALQWSQHEQSDFIDEQGNALLQQLFNQAAEHGLQVIVGLYHENSFYQRIKQQPVALHYYLARLAKKHQQVAIQWQPFTSKSNFAGWYISDEIDDLHWQNYAQQQELVAYLRTIEQQLKQLAPTKPIYMSSFYAGHSYAEQYLYLLTQIRQHTNIQLLWQDGQGTKVLSDTQRQAVQALICQDHEDIAVIAELFNNPAPLRQGGASECRNQWAFSLRYLLPHYFPPASNTVL